MEEFEKCRGARKEHGDFLARSFGSTGTSAHPILTYVGEKESFKVTGKLLTISLLRVSIWGMADELLNQTTWKLHSRWRIGGGRYTFPTRSSEVPSMAGLANAS